MKPLFILCLSRERQYSFFSAWLHFNFERSGNSFPLGTSLCVDLPTAVTIQNPASIFPFLAIGQEDFRTKVFTQLSEISAKAGNFCPLSEIVIVEEN